MSHQKELAALAKKATRLHVQLLQLQLDPEAVEQFYETCTIEAEIQHNLPFCRCRDVNHCDTWCRAKARFQLNPPD